MKVLMLSGDRLTPAGGRGPLYETQRGFSRWFERVDILLPRPLGVVTTRQILGNVHLHPAEGGRFTRARFWRAHGERLLLEHGHGLIVSHDYGLFQTGRAAAWLSRATGVPYLSEIHGVPGYPVASDLGERLKLSATKSYLRWAAGRAAAFRVVNAAELPPFLEAQGVPAGKIVVLRALYIDLATFRPAEQAPARRQDLIYAGRFAANKGLEHVIEALALSRARGKPLSARFVGKGPLENSLRRLADSRGVARQLTFQGWTDSTAELAKAYRESGVVVCASGCEGGPRSTVEGMACGLPAVSTPVGMMKELIVEGRNGKLCGFDAPSLADALFQVLADEPRRALLGRNAHLDAQQFEYEHTIRAYAEGVHRLAGQELPPAPHPFPAEPSGR
ncbi:MAG: glycosyltransferase family 4 protein [Planctomycetes bacterium]|nr:glycosyltransferase family 4 protein [Planctomycetota bacterium]